VPLTLASCEAAADKLGFDLKISNRGTKLKVLIRAGSTEARASLRFADAAR
jgi:coenzyme F420-reducing hydrogenase alpha subunit